MNILDERDAYEGEVISTDMYLKQNNYYDIEDSEELEVHISRYDTPQIQDSSSSSYGPWSDNAHLVFDVPKLKTKEY